MSTTTPWHRRGVRVPKVLYRTWYIAQLVVGALIVVSAITPAILLALNAVADTLGVILTAVAAVVSALVGSLLSWLAIHRLRNPVTPP